LALDAQLGLTELTVERGQGPMATTPLANESLTIGLNAKAADGLGLIFEGKVTATGSLLSLDVSNISAQLKGESKDSPPVSPLEIVRKADVTLDVPSLPKLKAAMDAFS